VALLPAVLLADEIDPQLCLMGSFPQVIVSYRPLKSMGLERQT
jgi:hypothetical protein